MKVILKRTGELVDVRRDRLFPELFVDIHGGLFHSEDLEFIKEKHYYDYFSYETTCTIPKECVDLQYVLK